MAHPARTPARRKAMSVSLLLKKQGKARPRHRFEESGALTVMKDTFEFESPGGILGKIFNRLILENYLKRVLEKRNKMIREVAEGEQWKTILNI